MGKDEKMVNTIPSTQCLTNTSVLITTSSNY
jgi:hypothetical protein